MLDASESAAFECSDSAFSFWSNLGDSVAEASSEPILRWFFGVLIAAFIVVLSLLVISELGITLDVNKVFSGWFSSSSTVAPRTSLEPQEVDIAQLSPDAVSSEASTLPLGEDSPEGVLPQPLEFGGRVIELAKEQCVGAKDAAEFDACSTVLDRQSSNRNQVIFGSIMAACAVIGAITGVVAAGKKYAIMFGACARGISNLPLLSKLNGDDLELEYLRKYMASDCPAGSASSSSSGVIGVP